MWSVISYNICLEVNVTKNIPHRIENLQQPHVLIATAILLSYWVAACSLSPTQRQRVSIWCHIYATPDAPTCVFAMPFVQFRHLGSAGGGLQYWLRANMVADGSSAVGLRVLMPLVFDTAKAKQPQVKSSQFTMCTVAMSTKRLSTLKKRKKIFTYEKCFYQLLQYWQYMTRGMVFN